MLLSSTEYMQLDCNIYCTYLLIFTCDKIKRLEINEEIRYINPYKCLASIKGVCVAIPNSITMAVTALILVSLLCLLHNVIAIKYDSMLLLFINIII